MLKIWGRVNSSVVQKVLWTAEELGLEYQRIDHGGQYGGNEDPDYLKLNPNGLIPTLEDGEFVLWESGAIMRYLASKYDEGGIYPFDLQTRAIADQWDAWHTTTIRPAMMPLLGAFFTVPDHRFPRQIEKARRECAELWRVVDNNLADRTYMTGDRFNIGDIPVGVHAYRWFNSPIERPSMPNLEAWYRRLCERPAFQRVLMQPITMT
jgi:glutathione S-transferase